MAAGDVHRYDNHGRMLDDNGQPLTLPNDTEVRDLPVQDSDRVKITKVICTTIGWITFMVLVYLFVTGAFG